MNQEILKKFVSNFPIEIQEMEESNHNYDNSHLNPYHMEGSVWTHTMMVYNEAIKMNAPKEVLFSALLHDLGKPFARTEMTDKSRVHFRGHDGISFYKAAEVLQHNCWDNMLNLDEKMLILRLVGSHSMLFDYKTTETNLYEKDQEFLNYLVYQVQADNDGRISKGAEGADYLSLYAEPDSNESIHSNKLNLPELTLLIGPPRIGKSTYIQENNLSETCTIISRDNLVLEHGIGDTYNKKWSSLSKDKHAEIDSIVSKTFQNTIRKNENVVIDMCNTSKKSRRKFISAIKQNNKTHWIKYIVFVDGFTNILNRAEIDETKKINPSIITNMMKGFTFPIPSEYDELVYQGY